MYEISSGKIRFVTGFRAKMRHSPEAFVDGKGSATTEQVQLGEGRCTPGSAIVIGSAIVGRFQLQQGLSHGAGRDSSGQSNLHGFDQADAAGQLLTREAA